MKASTTSQSASESSEAGCATFERAREASLRAPPGGVEDRGDGAELEAEAVVQHERHPLARRQSVDHGLERDADGVGERDVVGRVGRGLGEVDVLHRHRRPCAQPVEAQPRGDRGEPRGEVVDLGPSPRGARSSRSHACWTTSSASAWSPSTLLAMPSSRDRSASKPSVWSMSSSLSLIIPTPRRPGGTRCDRPGWRAVSHTGAMDAPRRAACPRGACPCSLPARGAGTPTGDTVGEQSRARSHRGDTDGDTDGRAHGAHPGRPAEPDLRRGTRPGRAPGGGLRLGAVRERTAPSRPRAERDVVRRVGAGALADRTEPRSPPVRSAAARAAIEIGFAEASASGWSVGSAPGSSVRARWCPGSRRSPTVSTARCPPLHRSTRRARAAEPRGQRCDARGGPWIQCAQGPVTPARSGHRSGHICARSRVRGLR